MQHKQSFQTSKDFVQNKSLIDQKINKFDGKNSFPISPPIRKREIMRESDSFRGQERNFIKILKLLETKRCRRHASPTTCKSEFDQISSCACVSTPSSFVSSMRQTQPRVIGITTTWAINKSAVDNYGLWPCDSECAAFLDGGTQKFSAQFFVLFGKSPTKLLTQQPEPDNGDGGKLRSGSHRYQSGWHSWKEAV